jgi:glycosyltransferase involved in cell wall biosynthesis
MASRLEVTLLTGGFDKPYAVGLATALMSRDVHLDVIGSDAIDCAALRASSWLTFLNLWDGVKPHAAVTPRLLRVGLYYIRLVRYSAVSRTQIFHILWNNKVQWFDRTFLMLYYRALRKRIVLTAHNVNAGKRDLNDSALNRLTLRLQYRLTDHVFVHTERMKCELQSEFGVPKGKISVIPFGINNSVPQSGLTPAEAKRLLGITEGEKTILFFGAIRPYKGLEYLVDAFLTLASTDAGYRLIIAGLPKKGCTDYLDRILRVIDGSDFRSRVVQRIQFIPDDEMEMYFKAADVLALPYTHVFQSGVLFLAYNYGLPVVATDVGSIREDIVEGRTGFLCRPSDSAALAAGFRKYFESDLFRDLDRRRRDISEYINEGHSWDTVGAVTRSVYLRLLGGA